MGLGEEGWAQRQGPHGYHQQQHPQFQQQQQQHPSSYYRRSNDDRLTHASYQVSPAPPPDVPTWRHHPHNPQQHFHHEEESPLDEATDLGFDLSEFEQRLAQPSALLMARMEASRLEAKAREQDVGRLEIEEIFSDINHITGLASLKPCLEKMEDKVFKEEESIMEQRDPVDTRILSREGQNLEHHQTQHLPVQSLSEEMRSQGRNVGFVEAQDQDESQVDVGACDRKYVGGGVEVALDDYKEEEDQKEFLEKVDVIYGRQPSVDYQEDQVNN